MKTLKLSLVALLVPLVVFAQTSVVKEAEGQAAVVNKDELKAYEDAKAAALRAAIESAAGTRIEADTVVVNNQLVKDQIFANTSGYVKKFDILEKKIDKGVATVKVKAEVITESLEKDITAARDLVKRIGRPNVIILIQENTLGADGKSVVVSNTLSTVISQGMTGDGYDVKDPAFANNGKLKVSAGIAMQQADAKEIGDTSKADFIIYGNANFRQDSAATQGDKVQAPVGNGFDKLFFVSGEYDLSVYATRGGSQIAKISNRFGFKDENSGIRNSTISYERTALQLALARKDEINGAVRKSILEHFRNEFVNGTRFDLAVSGLDSFGAAKDFKKSIESLKGLKEATQDSFSNGKAVYRVTFLGNAEEFADQLEASTFKKKKLSIVSQNGNVLEVQVAK